MVKEALEIPTPAVLVDLDIVEKNLRELTEGLNRYGIAYRPHIKTHKSLYFAELQKAYGASGITCSKLGEAEVFAEAGFDDILLAYPLIGRDKLERLKRLIKKGNRVRTVVNSLVGAKHLSDLGEELSNPIEVLLDIDGGMNRGGVKSGDAAVVLANSISSYAGIKIVGIEYFDGSIYGAVTEEEIKEHVIWERNNIIESAELLRQNGHTMEILSGGSSFSSKYPQYLKGLTEVRSGNCIFNDCTQLYKGLITTESCALRILATVVSKVDDKHVIIDAGTKTFSSDPSGDRGGYGYIIKYPHAQLWKMNEEHGFVKSEKSLGVEIGDKLEIIPNHSCQQANLFDKFYGIRGGNIERIIENEARGKSV